MPLATMGEIIGPARTAGRGVGAFNVIGIEHAEAELGEIGGKDGAHSPVARTDPDQAAGFVAATGVDALAVAVGSSHAMLTRDAVLDFGLVARLRRAVGVPLVLHGSSGVPDQDLAAAVRAGRPRSTSRPS